MALSVRSRSENLAYFHSRLLFATNAPPVPNKSAQARLREAAGPEDVGVGPLAGERRPAGLEQEDRVKAEQELIGGGSGVVGRAGAFEPVIPQFRANRQVGGRRVVGAE